MVRLSCVCLMLIITVSAKPMRKPSQRCYDKGRDFVFILDSSNSIWEPNFKRELEIMAKFVDDLNIGIGHDQSRVGVLTFSNKPHIEFYPRRYEDKGQLKGAIRGIGCPRGRATNTARAIQVAREAMFNGKYGSRSNVDRIAIVMSDGGSTDRNATSWEARRAREAGIQVFAIGIGQKFSKAMKDELVDIASSKEYVMFDVHVGNETAFNSIVPFLTERICQDTTETGPSTTNTSPIVSSSTPTTTTTTRVSSRITTSTESTTFRSSSTVPTSTATTGVPPVCEGKEADVFFILDSSANISGEEFKKLLQFVQNVIRRFDIGPSSTRVGLSTFGDNIHPVVNFDQSADKEAVLGALASVTYQGGSVIPGDAIDDMLNRAFGPRSARSGVEQIGVVITDGISLSKTSDVVREARHKDISLFAIGVGKAVTEEMKSLVKNLYDNYLDVSDVNSYDVLDALGHTLAQEICKTYTISEPIY